MMERKRTAFILKTIMTSGIGLFLVTNGGRMLCILSTPIVPAIDCVPLTNNIATLIRTSGFEGLGATLIGTMILFVIGVKGKKN